MLVYWHGRRAHIRSALLRRLSFLRVPRLLRWSIFACCAAGVRAVLSLHVSRVTPRPASAAGEAPVAVSRHYDAGVVALVAAGVRVACRSTSPGGASLALPPWLSALGTWLVALGSWLLACARRAVPANDPDLYTQRAYTCFECQCGRVRFTLCTSCPRRCCPSVRFRVSARAQVLRRRAEG